MTTSTGNGNGRQAFIGVDVGGTHTDVSIVYDGRVERGKALTTYDDFSRGVLEAVQVASGNYDMPLADMLGGTQLFINGTTVVTNAITQLRGSRVGVLITSGFRDTFRLAGALAPPSSTITSSSMSPTSSTGVPSPRSTSASTGRAPSWCRSTWRRSRPRRDASWRR
jgi:N-methylhydantoinase A/oxoprolinase/acetone carboxylase beta subunit